jgi:hypothetical protein
MYIAHCYGLVADQPYRRLTALLTDGQLAVSTGQLALTDGP